MVIGWPALSVGWRGPTTSGIINCTIEPWPWEERCEAFFSFQAGKLKIDNGCTSHWRLTFQLVELLCGSTPAVAVY